MANQQTNVPLDSCVHSFPRDPIAGNSITATRVILFHRAFRPAEARGLIPFDLWVRQRPSTAAGSARRAESRPGHPPRLPQDNSLRAAGLWQPSSPPAYLCHFSSRPALAVVCVCVCGLRFHSR